MKQEQVFCDEESTAVRDMKSVLDTYCQSASMKLAEVRDAIRRNTPPPASHDPEPLSSDIRAKQRSAAPAARSASRPPRLGALLPRKQQIVETNNTDEPPTRRLRAVRKDA